MIVRESPDELTRRAEEVNTSERWRPPMVDADWYAFRQKKCMDPHREMSKALVVKKRKRPKKAKLVAMRAAKDRGEGVL